MRNRKDRQGLVVGLAVLGTFLLLLALHRIGCQGPAEAYLGAFAPTDSVTFMYAVNDTSGNAANPDSVRMHFFKNGVLYDSLYFANWVNIHKPYPGIVKARRQAALGSGEFADYSVSYTTWIQGLEVRRSDNWQVDSLHAYETLIIHPDTAYAWAVNLPDTTYAWCVSGSDTLYAWCVDECDTVYAYCISGCDTVVCSTVVDTIFTYTVSADTTTTDMLERILGLLGENQYIDEADFIGSLMTQCRVRIYSDSTSVGTLNNVIATYRLTTRYDGNNLLTYKAVRE